MNTNSINELLTVWNGKLPIMGQEHSFWFRTLRWFFATFLLFAIIMFTGMYYLLSIAHPGVG